jgi:hypothetical protein
MEFCEECRQTWDVHGHRLECSRSQLSLARARAPRLEAALPTEAAAPRRAYVTDAERTDLLLKLGDALTANAALQHELTELTTECSRLDAELTGLAAVLRPIAHRRECLCVRGDDGLYAHPRCTAVHDEACVGVVRFERVGDDGAEVWEPFDPTVDLSVSYHCSCGASPRYIMRGRPWAVRCRDHVPRGPWCTVKEEGST